jgi:hypothetical protein
VCDSTEHRADFHGSKRDRAQAGKLPELSPDIAMRTMIDPFYAVYLVTEGSVGEALANATRAGVEARRVGITVGDTMLSALAELELRARNLSPELLVHARELRHKMDLATVAYRTVEMQITDHLGYPRKG